MSRLKRQSFLGAESDAVLEAATVGLVGLGGGGSHIAQQCALLGIGGFVNADPDVIEETNTNRLIGGTLQDVAEGRPKVEIAERLIQGLQPKARIIAVARDWREAADDLKLSDVIVGAMDSFKERDEIERFARRHLIPYIDIGMDVHDLSAGKFLVSGQVILSLPGHACMRCCGLITEERLAQEARHYGAAGSRPQVVWANGVLASSAVGLLTQLLTPWYADPPGFVFLQYDGNKGTVTCNPRMEILKHQACPHHPVDETGDPLFDIRTQKFTPRPAVTARPAGSPMSWWHRAWNRVRRGL